jgi:hypothetical protein
MNKKIVLLIAVLFVSIVFLSGCFDQISETVNPPDMRLTGQYKREGYEGLDRVGYVDITVTNNGGKGTNTVYVKVIQGNNQWTKGQTVTLNNGESTDLIFRFPEIEFWTTAAWSFTAWVE